MKTLTIAALGLRRLMRDRTGLFFVLLFPFLITLLIGLSVFRDLGSAVPVGVIDNGKGILSTQLVTEMKKSRALEIHEFGDRKALETAIRRDELQSGIVIGADYDAQLEAGEKAEVLFLPSPRVSNSQAIRSTVSSIITSQGSTIRAAVFATQVTGTFDSNLAIADNLSKQDAGQVTVSSASLGKSTDKEFQGFTYPSASNLVLFTFITSMTAAGQLVETRRLGISKRMLSTPTSAFTILFGQLLSRFVIALFQGLFIFGIGSLLFGVQWGNIAGTMLLITSFALVSTGIAVVFGSILKTQEQAGLGVPLGIALGMLGGCMWPLEIVGPAMRSLGHITPHAWAMDGFIALIGKDANVAGISRQLFVLFGFAVVLLAFAVRQFRRGLTG